MMLNSVFQQHVFVTQNYEVPIATPFYKEMWEYNNGNIEAVQKGVSNFDWKLIFQNLNVNMKFEGLN